MYWPEGWKSITSLMGVINLTPDSFSDGGRFLDPEKAAIKANEYLYQGADVLDLGAQSTRPGAEEVGADEELRRLIPAICLIRQTNKNALISVDTFSSVVAERALEEGANWINDVSGGVRDSRILSLVAAAKCPYVLMHSRGNSETMDKLTGYQNVVKDVKKELLKRTEKAIDHGINPELIIWDPGLGFAKTTEQNLSILNGLEEFSSEGFPLLVGPSRKRFIGDVLNQTNPLERLMGTAAVVCRCVQANVSIVRVHDVCKIRQTISMASRLW